MAMCVPTSVADRETLHLRVSSGTGPTKDKDALPAMRAANETLMREVNRQTHLNDMRRRAADKLDRVEEDWITMRSGKLTHVVPQSLHAHLESVGAASPLDLPDSDFNMLRPEVNGYEVTWKYVCKPYWCEVLKGYRLVLSGGKPLGTGWDELHANHKVLYVNHEMKVMNLDDEGAFQSYVASFEPPRAQPAVPPPAPPPAAPPPAATIKPPDTKTMVATADFKARHADELGFKTGDLITILGDAEDAGWHRGLLKGQTGLVPSTHLTAGSLTIKSILPPLAGPQPAASVPASRLFAPAPAATADSSAPAATADYTARAIADYTARAPDELSFKTGDLITILGDAEDAGWHRGLLKGQTGKFAPLLVPSTHVEKASSTTGTLRVKAANDYKARQPDELSFANMEDLDVYPDPVEPGWYQGFKLDKTSGLIPATHLEVAALNKLR